MARFYGEVGYGESVESAPGVYTEVITERLYFGDLVQNNRRLQEDGDLLREINVNNSVSIVADAYANEHFFAIRYVKWSGTRWVVTNVRVQSPRLILSLGGVYNGPPPG